jgi:hypothetical protein
MQIQRNHIKIFDLHYNDEYFLSVDNLYDFFFYNILHV